MAEYIEREAVFQKKTTMTEYDEGGWGAEVSVVRTEDIKAIPAADVAPVVHGRWMNDGMGDMLTIWKCSLCGYRQQGAFMRYYPNCGAKMGGEG